MFKLKTSPDVKYPEDPHAIVLELVEVLVKHKLSFLMAKEVITYLTNTLDSISPLSAIPEVEYERYKTVKRFD